ncbi:MAG: aldo/keto reductase [Acidobacteria bacterium]|nr:aldo/keto reductase [Acidobacteriota bacterium]
MNRRQFLQVSTAVAASPALADTPIPHRRLGKTGMDVAILALGGFHMAAGNSDADAIRIVHRAVDLGINFLDCALKYHDGRSEEIYGKALTAGRRQKIFLMTKAHFRDRAGAQKQLEDSLRRMNTDYLDLWQCHEVSRPDEVDRIFGPNGALEAVVQAKQDGKVRHIGFTGHHDPQVHLKLLHGYEGWETLQCPVNLIDPHYLSFIQAVLPAARKKGLGIISIKSNAIGNITKNHIATIPECLRFAWSQDVDVVVSGMDKLEYLEENVAAAKSFRPMSGEEQRVLLSRTGKGPFGSQVEQYKKKENA